MTAEHRAPDDAAAPQPGPGDAPDADATTTPDPVVTDAPDADVPGPDVPEADVPENDVPENDLPGPDVPEADVRENDVLENDVPGPDIPENDVPEDDVPEDDVAATDEGPLAGRPAEPEPVDPDPTAPTPAEPVPHARHADTVPPAGPPAAAAAAEAAGPAPTSSSSSVSRSWRTIARALAPRATRAQVLAGLLCALLGFAFVVQVQQNRSDGLSSLRQDELVRILDEVTQRTEELEDQAAELRAQRAELATGSDTRRAAREAATERAAQQGILAGRLPAQGPGVLLTVRDPDRRVPALVLYNLLEELRNAGAEAVQVNDQRVTASTYVVDTVDGVSVDGTLLEPPYRWVAIGDPDVIIPALNMPGGALAVVRGSDGSSEVEARDLVQVTAVRDVEPPRFATPAPATDEG